MCLPLCFSPDTDLSVLLEPVKCPPFPSAYYTLVLIPNHLSHNKISKTHHTEIPSPIFLHFNCQLIYCSDIVTFSCSIETLTLFYLPPPALITLGQRLQSTIAVGFSDSNERVLSASGQSLQSFYTSLGARHEANKARGQSQWPVSKAILYSKFPLSSNTDSLSLEYIWVPLGSYFFFALNTPVERPRKGT